MTKTRQIHLVARPQGMPKLSDFAGRAETTELATQERHA